MKQRTYILACGFVIAALNLFPLYQVIEARGYLFYANAYDETTYLQYDYSRATQGVTRFGQYLVTAAHEAGLSGGWINFLFDVSCVAGFLVVTRAILRATGFDFREANTGSVLLLVLPFLVNGANPLVNRVFNWTLESGAVRWVAVPEATFSPLVRSPEPQCSMLILSVLVFIAVRYRTWLPFVGLPLLYPFVAGPAVFVVLSVFLRKKWIHVRAGGFISWLVAFGVTCVLSMAPLQLSRLGLPDVQNVKAAVTETRLPLLSFSFVCCLMALLATRRWVSSEHTFLLTTVALTPFAMTNTQLISGFIAQPTNIEQTAGVFCFAVILALPLASRETPAWLRHAVVVAALFLLVDSSKWYFSENLRRQTDLLGIPGAMELLRQDSERIAIDSLATAGIASMIFPKQPRTLLAFSNATPVTAAATFPSYLCVRKLILDNPAVRERYTAAIELMDSYYRHETLDFVLLTQGRKQSLRLVHDPEQVPPHCPAMEVKYLHVE